MTEASTSDEDNERDVIKICLYISASYDSKLFACVQ